MKLFQADTQELRLLGAAFALALAISVLLVAFFQTQVVAGEAFAVRSEENRLRPITIQAPRGTIVDRNGEIIATSVTGYAVQLMPSTPEIIQQTLQDLAPFLGLSDQRIEQLMAQRNRRPNDMLEITRNGTYAQISALEERRAAFSNLVIAEFPRRHYPAGEAIGHVMGYLGEISPQELEQPRFAEAGYRQGRIIGKTGIEAQYELILGGEDGARFVEVDAMGRVVDPRPPVRAVPPRPGQDLQLTLDVKLQEYVHELFPDTLRGAFVAMVPSTGEVLALYSNPGFDPNDFVGGIQAGVWTALHQDPDIPLLNRATGGTYPPASTWKLATAAAGLQAGILTRNTRMPIACVGGMAFQGRYARCWQARGHGSLDLMGAILHSCNVYFYQVGIRLGLAQLIEDGGRMGFNTPTGIDLPVERTGTFPTGLEWYERRMGYRPPANEVMSLSIGQGPNDQTMLRLAHFYSAIAGNGSAPAPHLVVREGAGEGDGAILMEIDRQGLEALWEGLERTMTEGTGRMADLERWTTYGKTGTAQNPHGENHGVFTGFAGPPGEPPEIAFALIIEHAGGGSLTAAVATKAAQYYLDRKHGFEPDPAPTLFERLMAGRARW
jgi:penicillin-binding protein 2